MIHLPELNLKAEQIKQDSVEVIMKMADGSNGRVETHKDWQVVEAIFKIWMLNYKSEFKAAISDQKRLRYVAKNKFASNREKGGALIRHLINYPSGFVKLMHSVYPDQKLHDMKFAKRLLKLIPLFQVPEKV